MPQPGDKDHLLKVGETAPDFTLPTIDGTDVHLAKELASHKAVVVMFICNHCPYVKAYIPRLVSLQSEFASQVRFIAICANDAESYPDDSFDRMKEVAGEWGLNLPYAQDATQDVARAFGAQRTPEVFVLDAQGVCRYEGGIDDNYQDAAAVKRRPLHAALSALVAGENVTETTCHAIGCTIKWKK